MSFTSSGTRRAAVLVAFCVAAAMSGGVGAANAAARGPADGNAPLRYTVKALGTLGGDYSIGTALDTHTVVGGSLTAGDAASHAFAASLSTGVMTDLGTLGGAFSEAVAVDGRFVVGMSTTPSSPPDHGPDHAFAYDLVRHTITDMGTLGGSRTVVVGMADGVAVGYSELPGDLSVHAFVYDLSKKVMTDIGTLGGTSSGAAAISGHIVVGEAATTVNSFHAFAYDLRTGRMKDLGTLPGDTGSVASAISGNLVVGWSANSKNSNTHGFLENLATGKMTDLGDQLVGDFQIDRDFITGNNDIPALVYNVRTGTLTTLTGPGGYIVVTSLHGAIAAGSAEVTINNDTVGQAFVENLRTSAVTILPLLSGINSSVAQINSQGVIAGTASGASNGSGSAVIWTPVTTRAAN